MEKSVHFYRSNNSLTWAHGKQDSLCLLLPAIGPDLPQQSDPERGKGAKLDHEATAFSIVGVSTAVADRSNPSDEGAGRSGTSAAKQFLMSISHNKHSFCSAGNVLEMFVSYSRKERAPMQTG